MSLPPKYDRRDALLSFDQEELESLVSLHLGGARIRRAERLGGGYSNTNYQVVLEDERAFVVRFRQREKESLRKELAVLSRIAGLVPAPVPIASDLAGAGAFAILSYVEGESLEEALKPGRLSEGDQQELGASIGAALAEVHRIQLPRSGFFDGEFRFVHEFSDCGEAFLEHAKENLGSDRARQRVPSEVLDRMLALLSEFAPLVTGLPDTNRLVHADFNPKNILVAKTAKTAKTQGEWRVTGLIDWEFALAASPLTDFGNFLRFENELPEALVSAFIRGYERTAGTLPEKWRARASLLDLAAISGFLVTEEERPNAIRTATELLRGTMERFERRS